MTAPKSPERHRAPATEAAAALDGGRSPEVSLLVFEIGARMLALPATCVDEVIRAVAVTRLPKAPPILQGVINVRGKLVPVLDLRLRFNLPSVLITPDEHFILARCAARTVALRVDRVIDLVPVAGNAIESATQVAPGVEFASGIAKLPEGLLVIHDLDRLLCAAEALEIDQLLARAPLQGSSAAPSSEAGAT